MEVINLFLHLDKTLGSVIQGYGTWVYLILFLIIFCETGLVVTPFLPGDSLLFAAGAFAGLGDLNVGLLFLLLFAAAVIGDNTNYAVGSLLSKQILEKKKIRFVKKEYLDKTHKFYERYGVKTIIIARFVPIVRTFAPFVAGIGKMTYKKFLFYNVFGGFIWIGVFVWSGYFFGNLQVVKNNFSIIVLAIILISVLPMVIEFIKHRAAKSRS